MVLHLIDSHLDIGQLLHGFLNVELGDFSDRLLAKLQNIVTGDFLFELVAIGVESAFHLLHLILPSLRAFILHDFVDTFLEEYFLEGNPMPTVLQLAELDFQFLAKEVFGAHCVVAQDIAGGHEDGFIVYNDTSLRREGYLAVGESIEGIDGLVGRDA